MVELYSCKQPFFILHKASSRSSHRRRIHLSPSKSVIKTDDLLLRMEAFQSVWSEIHSASKVCLPFDFLIVCAFALRFFTIYFLLAVRMFLGISILAHSTTYIIGFASPSMLLHHLECLVSAKQLALFPFLLMLLPNNSSLGWF